MKAGRVFSGRPDEERAEPHDFDGILPCTGKERGARTLFQFNPVHVTVMG